MPCNWVAVKAHAGRGFRHPKQPYDAAPSERHGRSRPNSLQSYLELKWASRHGRRESRRSRKFRVRRADSAVGFNGRDRQVQRVVLHPTRLGHGPKIEGQALGHKGIG